MKSTVKLLPSDKVVGDLIARIPQSQGGSLIVVIDKKNEHFETAQAGEIWQVDYTIKGGWALGQLENRIKLEYQEDFDEHGPFIRITTGTEIEGIIRLPYSGKVTDYTRYNFKFCIEQLGLEFYQSEIMDVLVSSTIDMRASVDICVELANQTMELFKAHMEDLDLPYKPLEIEQLIFAQFDPLADAQPSPEAVLEIVLADQQTEYV
jgi:hypothetical protein